MNREQFTSLLARRDALQREHETACAILEEEGPSHAHHNYRECVRRYDRLAAAEAQIETALEAERAAEARTTPSTPNPPGDTP